MAKIAVIGASSAPGHYVLSMLQTQDHEVVAFTRKTVGSGSSWQQLNKEISTGHFDICICLAPIWTVPEYFNWMHNSGIKKVIAVSSTSVITKAKTQDQYDFSVVQKLQKGEKQLRKWAIEQDVSWVVLRPTLIYGDAKDQNITSVARFIRRFHFFPLLGKASGLRQPIHARDVASACTLSLSTDIVNKAYNITGSETLTYREMVTRVFKALNKTPRLLTIPLPLIRVGLTVLNKIPGFTHITPGMAERMNQNMTFGGKDEVELPGFKPTSFTLTEKDVVE